MTSSVPDASSENAATLRRNVALPRLDLKQPITLQLTLVLVAAITFVTGLFFPRALLDDVDAAEALQAKHMLLSGDWVTQQLDGIKYLDKAPLKYWITASLYGVFGVHTWVARLPTVLAAVLLCWLVFRIGMWADSPRTGFYSGLVLATSIGLFLFTRIIIPDVILTLLIAACLWCFIRSIEDEKPARGWAYGMYAASALAVLTKGFIGVVFPAAIVLFYLLSAGLLWRRDTWKRLQILPGLAIFLALAAPWHILAILRNPPYFDFTLHPGPHFGGKYRGFFWFYFINEQALRFLNERWPRDYNTVPRAWFWLSQLVWFFPWSVFLPGAAKLNFRPVDRASRLRVLLLCWIGVVMVFFTFSTTQEYYSMPMYPAMALLIGSAMAVESRWNLLGTRLAGSILLSAGLVCAAILIRVWSLPTPGDIYTGLGHHPELYTLALGHMADLTLNAFAYLRLPLAVASLAFLAGGLGGLFFKGERLYGVLALCLLLFFQAAFLALNGFEPYLSSRAIGEALNRLPQGTVIICGKYNPLSSVFFYSKDRALQDGEDLDILEYGALAPNAPRFAISDEEMKALWESKQLVYIVCKQPKLAHVHAVLGPDLPLILDSADKHLFTNHPRISQAASVPPGDRSMSLGRS